MKKNILILLCWILFNPVIAQDTIVYKFWVSFTDKNETPFETGSPEEFLSDRAIQRRDRYDIPVTESDLPVNPVYTDSIRKLGAHVLYTSKWFNAAVIETSDSLLIQLLKERSFIDHPELLYKGPIPADPVRKALSKNEDMSPFDYGPASQQIMIHHGEELHEEGYQGQNMLIALLDGGFRNVDSLPAFESLRLTGRILGTKDFVKAGNNVYREHDHGMKVLSIIGGYIPGELVGTAPKANFWLLRSEDVYSEYRIEEANWIAAAEFADSVGADVINSSLGYSEFDDYLQNYTYEDMDGNTTLVTRGADMAASKGILVVNSAGNAGNKQWKYITAPADGDSVLALGAVNPDGIYAPFSSQGPTFDSRIKPNVVAIGSGTYIQKIDSTVGQGSGTSFSSPVMAGLAACLWQKFRDLSNFEIIQTLEQSSSMYPYPDNFIGYGIPNLGVANDIITGKAYNLSSRDLLIYPNPAGHHLFITLPFDANQVREWEIFDVAGRKIRSSGGNISLTGTGFYIDSLEDMNPGLYIDQNNYRKYNPFRKIYQGMTSKNDRHILKLSELNLKVQSIIHNHFPENVWTVAEISEIKMNTSGHCYLELIEKDPDTERITARARATIWSFTFRMLKPYFETTTGYELKEGIKILISVKVEFHEIYGYSLNIKEIDPTYTLGDIERKRQEIIAQLQKEGVMNMNKDLPLTLVPQKIAVISSETAAGYKDFINQLENNPHGYKFYCLLFPSIMQGGHAEASIIKAFEKIYQNEHFFDAVVIIRGGGSKADLSTFDNYNIAFHITQFPLPVLTGIGHEQDDTIADMVSHLKLKTPTALAEFLISRAHDFDQTLSHSESKLTRLVGSLIGHNHKLLAANRERFIAIINMKTEHEEDNLRYYPEKIGSVTGRLLDIFSDNIRLSFKQFITAGRNLLRIRSLLLNNLVSPLHPAFHNFLEMKRNQLDLYCQVNTGLNPEKIFERGYSITLLKGKPLKDAGSVDTGDIIETHLHKGILSSEVRNKINKTE